MVSTHDKSMLPLCSSDFQVKFRSLESIFNFQRREQEHHLREWERLSTCVMSFISVDAANSIRSDSEQQQREVGVNVNRIDAMESMMESTIGFNYQNSTSTPVSNNFVGNRLLKS